MSGATEGATGTVVSVEGHVVHLVSDRTKELVRKTLNFVIISSLLFPKHILILFRF